ncbi:MAG: molecular chaperone DnaJ [Gallionella sp.]
MSAKSDYYEVLGVAKDADQKAIKDAFRTLALKYHPDRNKEPGAEEHFKEIAEAYAILSDPKKRAEYDARGFAGVQGFSQEDLFGGIDFEDIFGGLNFDFGFGGDSPFEGLFHRRSRGPARGANIEVELSVPLEKVAGGGEGKIRLSRPSTCPDCHGRGTEGGTEPKVCEACKGTGRITRSSRSSGKEAEHILIQQISSCPVCHGRGSIIEHPCAKCHGSGAVEQEEDLTVKIPKGVEEGMALRIPGKGMPSRDAGGETGDLFVVVRSKPDPRFERSGADLLRQETISLTDAVLGATLEVPTLDGSATVTIPPGTQPDAVLRLKGKGLPQFGNGRDGEMYLRIAVHVPEKISREERALYEQLRAIGGKEGWSFKKMWK